MKEHELYNSRSREQRRAVRDIRTAQVIAWGLIIVGVVVCIYGILEHL